MIFKSLNLIEDQKTMTLKCCSTLERLESWTPKDRSLSLRTTIFGFHVEDLEIPIWKSRINDILILTFFQDLLKP